LDELSYPSFPWRAFVAIGAVVLLLAVAVIAGERAGNGTASASSATVGQCATAAARVMSANDYSVDMLALMGPGSVRRCHGLAPAKFGRALLGTYRIEYGRNLPRSSSRAGTPSPEFRARSALAALRSAAGS
jgi:hypothetical protein